MTASCEKLAHDPIRILHKNVGSRLGYARRHAFTVRINFCTFAYSMGGKNETKSGLHEKGMILSASGTKLHEHNMRENKAKKKFRYK
jgi:hypothetical protein